MADLAELERMIRELHDIEAIKKLKAKYWRCLDKKLWTEMEDVFAEDAKADYGPKYKLDGRDAILQFLKDNLGPDNVSTSHGGHSCEIDITGDTSAKGIWAMNNLMIREPSTRIMEWGHYEDEYIKQDGRWQVKSTKIVHNIGETTIARR